MCRSNPAQKQAKIRRAQFHAGQLAAATVTRSATELGAAVRPREPGPVEAVEADIKKPSSGSICLWSLWWRLGALERACEEGLCAAERGAGVRGARRRRGTGRRITVKEVVDLEGPALDQMLGDGKMPACSVGSMTLRRAACARKGRIAWESQRSRSFCCSRRRRQRGRHGCPSITIRPRGLAPRAGLFGGRGGRRSRHGHVGARGRVRSG